MRYRGRPRKDPMDELLKNIKKEIKLATKETAEILTYEIEKEYERTIENFYNDKVFYNGVSKTNIPKYYQRTESSYEGSNIFSNSLSGTYLSGMEDYVYPYKNSSIGSGYVGGIHVSDRYIHGQPYRAKAGKSWVFERTFKYGIHGVSRNDARVFKNKPENKNKRFWLEKLGRKKKGNASFYSYQQGSKLYRIRRYPNITNPSPKQMMDAYYKIMQKPKGQRHAQELFNTSLNERISKYI